MVLSIVIVRGNRRGRERNRRGHPTESCVLRRHAGDLDAGLQVLDLGNVFIEDHAAASGHHQRGRGLEVGQVVVEVHRVEVIEGSHDGGFVAGVQPFGAQLQLCRCPRGAEGAHRLRVHADQGLADGVDVPRQLARVFAVFHCTAHGKACPHGVAHQVVAVQVQRIGEGTNVLGAGVRAVIQLGTVEDRPRPRTSST
ncbi:hypothetical protein Ddc_21237 [Ditylenchus destructor]|nr:hypothetical protein Ddc_21237 [Ditylenchus destructor]